MATKKKTDSVVETETERVVQEEKKPVKIIPKEVDLHEYIPVRNGSQGRLVYISKRTGERFVWEEFGDTQEMELQELRNAKASSKKFFERNWFMFDKDYNWVIDYLGLKSFYRHSISVEGFDELFTKSPAEVKKICGELSAGQKRSVSYRARQLIAEGGIDSMKVIAALEEGLGVELIER